MMELTKETWLPQINNAIYACQDINELLMELAGVISMRRFEGVFPYCVSAARNQLKQICGPVGTTVAIDGESILFTAGFAKTSLDTLASRVIDILRNIWNEIRPQYFIVAFDDDRRFRRELFPEYKSDRKHDPRKCEIEARKREVIGSVMDLGVQVEIVEGLEADDVLASVSSQCQLLDMECVIVASDKDCWQCLGPRTTIYNRKDHSFLGTQWLKSKHRITPHQVVDWLVLVGKNGIKGAHGIGPETASDLLEAFGTYWDVRLSNLTPSKREAIEAIDYWKLRELHSLKRDVPIGRKNRAAQGGQNESSSC